MAFSVYKLVTEAGYHAVLMKVVPDGGGHEVMFTCPHVHRTKIEANDCADTALMQYKEDGQVGDMTLFDVPNDWTVKIAKWFHDAYEQMAPQHGYETKVDSRVPWDGLDRKLRLLMMDTVAVVLSRMVDEGMIRGEGT